MKLRNMFSFIIIVLIGCSIALGLAIIYADYIYNPYDKFSSINIMSIKTYEEPEAVHNSEININKRSEIIQNVVNWAKQHQATIIFKNGEVPGAGICDYSSWLEKEVGLDFNDLSQENIFLSDEEMLSDSYVNDGYFLPDKLNLKVAGLYSKNKAPVLLQEIDFLFNLSLSNEIEGVYLTNASNIDGLINLFSENDYMVIGLKEASSFNLITLIKQLIADGFLSRSMLCAMIGLLFCFIYLYITTYQDVGSNLWLHHIFGLSLKRILSYVIILMLLSIALSIFIFNILLENGVIYMRYSDLNSLLIIASSTLIFLHLIMNSIGYYRLMRHFKKREGRYGIT